MEAKKSLKKNPRGRPPVLVPDEKTLKTIEAISSQFNTMAGAAAILLVNRDTFSDFLKKYPDAQEMWDRGVEKGKAALRKAQWNLAMKGHAAMLIWLGKQYLDQKDATFRIAGDPDGVPVGVEAVEGGTTALLRAAREAKE